MIGIKFLNRNGCIAFLQCYLPLLTGYTFYYSNRNIITAASPYLIDHNVFTQKTFAIMQTSSYAMMIFAKFFIGLLLSMLPHRIRARCSLYTLLLVLIAIALIIVSVTSMLSFNDRVVAIVFVIAFPAIKIMSAVIRPILLSVGHVGMQSVWGYDDETTRVRLGWLSSGLQCLSCLGDVLGKLLFTYLVTNTVYEQHAKDRHIPVWTLAMLTLGCINMICALFTICPIISKITRVKNVQNCTAEKTNKVLTISWRTMVMFLFRSPSILLLLFANIISGFGSVASGSYAVHFYRYALGVDSLMVTRLDCLAPVFIAVSIFVVTIVFQRFPRKAFWFIISLALLDACLTRGIHELIKRHSQGMSVVPIIGMNILHQSVFFGYTATLDGLMLARLLPSNYIPSTTGILSAFNYCGSVMAPVVFYRWISTHHGWLIIISIVSWLQIGTMLTLSGVLLSERWRSGVMINKM